ncbi:MAG: addiction module protein [Balneolaceae bacterium]
MDKTKLEKKILDLPPAEREQLAVTAWESLEADTAFVTDYTFDPEGVDLALKRDNEIESGSVKSMSHAQFQKLTGSKNR